MGDGLIVTDRRGYVIEVNPAAIHILGGKNVLGRTPADLFGVDFDGNCGSSGSGGTLNLELPWGDKPLYLNIRWWPVLDRWSKTNGRIFLLHDESEIMEAQKALIGRRQPAATLEERERLARELHDGTGQIMGYLNIRIQTIRSRILEGDTAGVDSTGEPYAEESSSG